MDESFYQTLWAAKLSGRKIDTEITNRRKDGRLYTVIAHISPIKDAEGNIVGHIGTEEDVTSIRAAERAAKEAQGVAERQNKMLERMNRLMVGRELKMREMKKEIEAARKRMTDLYGGATDT